MYHSNPFELFQRGSLLLVRIYSQQSSAIINHDTTTQTKETYGKEESNP